MREQRYTASIITFYCATRKTNLILASILMYACAFNGNNFSAFEVFLLLPGQQYVTFAVIITRYPWVTMVFNDGLKYYYKNMIVSLMHVHVANCRTCLVSTTLFDSMLSLLLCATGLHNISNEGLRCFLSSDQSERATSKLFISIAKWRLAPSSTMSATSEESI